MLIGVTGAGLGSPASRPWTITNLVRIARHRYRAYVGIRLIRVTRGGIYWTAYRQHTDGKTLEVFRRLNGRIAGLGSPGRSRIVVAVNDREQFVTGTGIEAPLGGPTSPPIQRLPAFHAYLWQNGKLIELGTLGGASTYASAINDQRQVVGTRDTRHGSRHAFLWQDGKMTDLGTLGGRSSSATAIDDQGRIVGWSDTQLVPYTAFQAPGPRPFLWQHGTMVELPTLVASPTRAVAIGRRGTQIVGGADYPGGNQILLWNPPARP